MMADPAPYRARDWDVHPAYDYPAYASTKLRAPNQKLVSDPAHPVRGPPGRPSGARPRRRATPT